ncbi:MarR family winged helix-turn-helix transcriptional regulator [Spirochaeta cellobiosiphila]|uniref:MarR family winged helix-turn-helix transcriptional regulator n=1 Tax=Spirochaeta cellobiosiphila TaxID=504483 RepID=UPI00041D6061|nr:winged helix-turn-helix transcriptional regulator [Spirochaeta cellobiosiphila]
MNFPGISNAEVARKCFVSPQTIILIVNKLEENGLIKWFDSETHGRIQKIELTPRGLALLKEADGIVFAIEDKLFAALSKREVETLCDLLGRVKTVS